MKIYTMHTDPGHGWLEVSAADVEAYCDWWKITPYSYVTKDIKTFYLEEDCDAGLFIEGLRKHGVKFSIEDRHIDEDHWIKRLPTVFVNERKLDEKQ